MERLTQHWAPTLAFLSCLVLASCEKPELARNEADNPASGGPVVEEPVDAPVAAESTIEERPEPTYPSLIVSKIGDDIVIEGALKSRLQKARIAEDLTRAFPDLSVDDRLKVESHRYAVGWGNRVSDGFLIPFLQEVEDPYVEYKDGIVILKGRVERRGFRKFQELAVNIFAGMYLKDIENSIQEY